MGIFHYAGRLLLTVLTLFVFLWVLVFIVKIHAAFLASQAKLHNQSVYVGNNNPPAPSDSAVHPFWPEFPRSGAENAQSAVINGVQIITESWESSASALVILSYYREQMAARGWRDVTEETYGLKPESSEAANNTQDERYVSTYRKVMDANLVVTSGEWSMHISAEPDKINPREIAVKIFAAATPSMKDYVDGMASTFAKNSGQPNQPLDAVQQSGKERYHTTITAKNEPPMQAFQETLVNLKAQGWQPVMYLPKQQTRLGIFAWLLRGKQYAALSVSVLPRDGGSSVTFTEVTPE